MAFVSLAGVNNTAPGLFITERSAGAIAPPISTFNSTYLFVECDDDVSIETFPFNEPVQVVNLDDYLNRIGGSVPLSGAALTSYNSVKLFFRNAGAAILYVIRVGRPEQVIRITIDGNTLQKKNDLGVSSAIAQGDSFYVRAAVNDFPLGLLDVNGVYLGVPVVVSPSLTNNAGKAALAAYIRDQIVRYINDDISIRSGVYVRSISSLAENNTQHWVEISPRTYGQNISYILDGSVLEDEYVSTSTGHTVADVNPANVTTYLDYVQAVQTALKAEYPQGFLIAPPAFAQFKQSERLAIGAAMEAVASADEFNHFAIVDQGPVDVDEIENYNAINPLNISQNYVIGNQVKHSQTVYEFLANYTAPSTNVSDTGIVRSVAITNAGTSYTNGTYSGVATTTSGTGTGLTVNVTVAGGVVTAVTPVARGSGYATGDTISITNTLIGGTGSGFSGTITAASMVVANNATVVFPATPGNNFLKDGITINDVHYALPLILTNSSGGNLFLSDVSPSTGSQLDALEEDMGLFVIKDDKITVNGLLRTGGIKKIESAIHNHSEAFKESQLYSSPLGYLAYYAPYLVDLEGYLVPASAAVAGVAVRRYMIEGFQQPPAGVTYALKGVSATAYEITKQHQMASNPLGLNAVRALNGQGIVIWGARTRSTNPYYRWVNTRIILNVIIGTLRNAFDTLIFNAIDGQNVLFNRVKSTAEGVLYRFWIGSALFGATPGDAYLVICDKRNNPNLDLEDGLVRCTLFVTPVPTLERLSLEIVRVGIGGLQDAALAEGYA